MRPVVLLSALALMLATTTPSTQAQGLSLALDIPLVTPIGDWKDTAGTGFGALLKVDFSPLPFFAWSIRGGYIYHLEQDSSAFTSQTSQFPVLFGGRIMPVPLVGLYLAAEVGFAHAIIKTTNKATGDETTSKDTHYSLAMGPGIELGPIDFRASYYTMSVVDILDTSGFLFTLSWSYFGILGGGNTAGTDGEHNSRERKKSKRRRRSFDWD